MEKIVFQLPDSQETVDFFVLEQTKIKGYEYILVTDSEEEEAEAYIMKDVADEASEEAVYEMVDDDDELEAVAKIFAEILEEIDLESE